MLQGNLGEESPLLHTGTRVELSASTATATSSQQGWKKSSGKAVRKLQPNLVSAAAEHRPTGNMGLKGHESFICERKHLPGGATGVILPLELLEVMWSTADSKVRTI